MAQPMPQSASMQLLEAKREISKLQEDLKVYKQAVEKLAFELEMAHNNFKGADAAKAIAAARKAALEQAADLLMDHGVVVSGHELVAVCEQIKSLTVATPAEFPWSQNPGGKPVPKSELPSWLR